MDDMVSLISTRGEFESGSRQPRLIAQDWIDEGFDRQEASSWIDAGCWSPVLAAVLRDRGISPAEAGLPD